MNREIKFRAWDGHFTYQDKCSSWSAFWDYVDPTHGDGPILQQFTGFKDQNGKEVYEGDIIGGKVEMVYLMSGLKTGKTQERKYKIIWEEDRGKWGTQCITDGRISPCNSLPISLKYYTVIGNIFENPELCST